MPIPMFSRARLAHRYETRADKYRGAWLRVDHISIEEMLCCQNEKIRNYAKAHFEKWLGTS